MPVAGPPCSARRSGEVLLLKTASPGFLPDSSEACRAAKSISPDAGFAFALLQLLLLCFVVGTCLVSYLGTVASPFFILYLTVCSYGLLSLSSEYSSVVRRYLLLYHLSGYFLRLLLFV